MLRRLLKKRWPVILICTVLVLMIAGASIGRNTPSEAVFARVSADDTGTQIDFFIANSGWIPHRFSCRLQNRTLKVDLRADIFGENIGDSFRIGIPADAYDDIVIRCNGHIVSITN